MPVINISLSEDEYNKLQEEHKKAVARAKHDLTALPATFEEWIVACAANGNDATPGNGGLDDLRAFNAIEKLITSLRSHGFGLAHLGKQDGVPADSARDLAETIVRNLGLSQQQLKRIQDLVEYYSKAAKEIADAAHVGITNRAYGALHEAYRELADRADKSLDRIGEERAIGRVEGAIAILVNVHVMDRQAAKEKTEAFKALARNPRKRSG
jgi:tetratricopeptide (TPR) repeat protein